MLTMVGRAMHGGDLSGSGSVILFGEPPGARPVRPAPLSDERMRSPRGLECRHPTDEGDPAPVSRDSNLALRGNGVARCTMR